eukprot:4492456-Amphidinium_carterae.3
MKKYPRKKPRMDSTSQSDGSMLTKVMHRIRNSYRSRIVARELKTFHQEMRGTVAATPPLESMQMMLSAINCFMMRVGYHSPGDDS